MYVPPVYRLRNIGRGRYSDRNATQIPPGGARDSLNLDHGLEDIEARIRQATNRTWKARPASPGAGTLAMFEHIRSAGTSAILVKIGDTLYSTSYPSLTLTVVLSGMSSTFRTQFATFGDQTYVADSAANYITDATSATTFELQKASPNGTFSGASGGTATGNVAADIVYWFTDVEPGTGMECPPTETAGQMITVTRSADQGVNLSGLSYSGAYTRKKIYRRKYGDAQPYFVGTVNSPTTTYADTSVDTDLTQASTVHDEVGNPSIEKPAAAKYVCVHRGRVWLAYGNTVRFSRLYEGTQYENFSYSTLQINPNDGDVITGIVSFKGALVVFKKRSIYTINGDTNDRQFVVGLAIQGVGARAHRTIVPTEDAIFFLSEGSGVHAFTMDRVRPVSDNIDGDLLTLAWTYADNFCAGYNRRKRQYFLSVAPNGATTNTKTHVLNVQTGAWGRADFSTGVSIPTCYAELRNADGDLKLYTGDANGYSYEHDTTTGADGVPSGTKSGVVTSSSGSTKATIATAAFFATSDGLKGLSASLVTTDGTIETREIASNTATEVTVSVAWTVTIVGSTLYIGALDALLNLNRTDLETAGYKVINRINVEWEKQSHTTPLQVGFVVDGDTAPTTKYELLMNSDYRGAIPVGRPCVGISMYFRLFGVDLALEIILVEMAYRPLMRRQP